MKILFLGDVVGRNARDEITKCLPGLRDQYSLDAVIVNAENAAHGFGVTAQICADFYKAGVDCITTGNHLWDQREIIAYIGGDPKLLRPINFPEGTPGRGFYIIETLKITSLIALDQHAAIKFWSQMSWGAFSWMRWMIPSPPWTSSANPIALARM